MDEGGFFVRRSLKESFRKRRSRSSWARLRKSKGRSLQRDGDRLVYVSTGREGPLRKVEEFLDLLDE